MRTISSLILLMIACLASSAPSQAAPTTAAADWKSLSAILDKDKNGKLSEAEVNSFNPLLLRMLSHNFKNFDSNGDGQVTSKEYTSFFEKERKLLETAFSNADTDKSGGLSMAELDASDARMFRQIKRNFDRIDANHDGQITLEEFDLERQQFSAQGNAGKREKAAGRNMKHNNSNNSN